MFDADNIDNLVGFLVLLIVAGVVITLIARDLLRDRQQRKGKQPNSAVPRGPWYPRFLPLGHFFDGLGEAIEHNHYYKYAAARAVTVLACLLFILIVWACLVLFLARAWIYSV